MKAKKVLAVILFSTTLAALSLTGCGGKKREYIEGVSYVLAEDYAIAISSDPEYENPVIQKVYQDMPVQDIDQETFKENPLTQITIPESVELVCSGAFTNCAQLREVTIEGLPKLNDGCFTGCDALERVIWKRGVGSISMDAFEDCPSLTELHIPPGCKAIEGTVPDGVTLYIQTVEMLELAVENGWDFRMEDGSEVVRTNLSEAVESGKISFETNGIFDLVLKLHNVSGEVLIVENVIGTEIPADDVTFYVKDGDANDSFVMMPGKERELYVEYYGTYGPEETTVQLAAESQYMTVRIFAGKHEQQDEYLVAPYEQVTITLPCGRYSMSILEGETKEDAAPENREEDDWKEISAREFEADKSYEVSPWLGGGYTVYELEEYGPGTSGLYLRTEDHSACYRLVRVGGEMELEVFLEPHSHKTVSFPSGRYRLRIAEGDNWISEEEAFGEEGEYSVINYFSFEDGETYEITTSDQFGPGGVHGDSAGGFGHKS